MVRWRTVGDKDFGIPVEFLLAGVVGELANARAYVAVATERAQNVVREAAASGVSERAIAKTTGLSRDTVRRWLGK